MLTVKSTPRPASLCFAALLASVAIGCGNAAGPSDAAGDTPPDVVDAVNPPDDQAGEDVQSPDAPDGPYAPDTAADAPADTPVETYVCASHDPWPSIDDGTKKFGLTMFHWNIQYVAGGLIGTWNGQTISLCNDMFGSHDACEGWTDDALNDWIIRISFQPILDMYLAHPAWRATFEMPGLMVEAMAARHPDVLAKLQCAANSGQIEIVSFHWSDQLFLAFPSRDLQWSIDHNRQVMEDAALPLSGVVFDQEGQSGLGKHRVMADNGYAIDVLSRNLYRYHQVTDVDDGVWPVYESTGPGASKAVKVVVGGGADPAAGVEADWTFFDDGEVLATPGAPYLAPVTPEPDWAEVEGFALKLQEKADAGTLHTTITDYVARLDRLDIQPRPLLPIVDSTWQPPSTEGISRWMGRMGTLAMSLHENDNLIRTGNYRASTCLAGAALLADLVAADSFDVTDERAWIDTGYSNLVRAEVSDATGINPWMGEWVYGFQFNQAAETECARAVDSLLAKWGKGRVTLDLDARVSKPDGTFLPQFDLAPTAEADVPVALTVTSEGRQVEALWSNDGPVYRLQVAIGASDEPTGENRAKRTVTLRMPLSGGHLRYTPALVEDVVTDVALSEFHLLAARMYLPLANGLIGLGPDLWLLKSCRDVHLAARVGVATDGDTLEFIDETVPTAGDVQWVFYVLKGTSAEALHLARLVNTHPNVVFTRP